MNAIKVFKLDLLSIKPYLTIKNLIILIGLGTLYGVLSKNPAFVLATVQMFAILFSGYPFMVGEESGIDPLYKLFSISSKDVVKGRYLLATVSVIVMLVVGVVMAMLIGLAYPMEDLFNSLLLTAPCIGMISLIIIFIEYPIYFKYGYKKGKTLTAVPMLLLAIGAVCSAYFNESLKSILQFLVMNPFLAIAVICIIFIIIVGVSIQLSNKLYARRDF
ncbi:ABC-2 transporter permease [uncultured Solobacterium sp.]|uniref:ABC-2 transporter permease n=1 Tax=uncultured Solobacterium sp. TaxID=747375 RepID=UPI0028D123F7|nr:ABC-2 transporter permease [uncultured Solobacterium sp.]